MRIALRLGLSFAVTAHKWTSDPLHLSGRGRCAGSATQAVPPGSTPEPRQVLPLGEGRPSRCARCHPPFENEPVWTDGKATSEKLFFFLLPESERLFGNCFWQNNMNTRRNLGKIQLNKKKFAHCSLSQSSVLLLFVRALHTRWGAPGRHRVDGHMCPARFAVALPAAAGHRCGPACQPAGHQGRGGPGGIFLSQNCSVPVSSSRAILQPLSWLPSSMFWASTYLTVGHR